MKKKEQALRPVDKPFYRYWNALYLAFYSRKLYVDVAKRWRGFGFIYFFILITIAVMPLATRVSMDFSRYVNQQFFLAFQEMPAFEIRDGQVLFERSMPYRVKNKSGAVIGIIDTTGHVMGMRSEYPQLSVLVTRDKIYFRPPAFQLFFTTKGIQKPAPVYAQSISELQNGVFDGQAWVNSTDILVLKWGAVVCMYPIIILFLFGFFLTLLMVFALIGQAYSLIIFKFKLNYQMSCRMALVASTPLMMVIFLLMTMNHGVYGAGLTSLVLFSFYFSYAVLCVRRESKRMVLA
ncbi:DUF1189 domain-containing protein [bacterium]|nr:DUF1189 domain-containing protein [bacterium]